MSDDRDRLWEDDMEGRAARWLANEETGLNEHDLPSLATLLRTIRREALEEAVARAEEVADNLINVDPAEEQGARDAAWAIRSLISKEQS